MWDTFEIFAVGWVQYDGFNISNVEPRSIDSKVSRSEFENNKSTGLL